MIIQRGGNKNKFWKVGTHRVFWWGFLSPPPNAIPTTILSKKEKKLGRERYTHGEGATLSQTSYQHPSHITLLEKKKDGATYDVMRSLPPPPLRPYHQAQG